MKTTFFGFGISMFKSEGSHELAGCPRDADNEHYGNLTMISSVAGTQQALQEKRCTELLEAYCDNRGACSHIMKAPNQYSLVKPARWYMLMLKNPELYAEALGHNDFVSWLSNQLPASNALQRLAIASPEHAVLAEKFIQEHQPSHDFFSSQDQESIRKFLIVEEINRSSKLKN